MGMPCETVTVPEKDESEVVIQNVAFNPTDPRTVNATIEVKNDIISGDGVSISPTLEITADGDEVVNEELSSIDPGLEQTFEVELTNLPTGSVEMCANLV